MMKLTLLLILLMVSTGYSQTNSIISFKNQFSFFKQQISENQQTLPLRLCEKKDLDFVFERPQIDRPILLKMASQVLNCDALTAKVEIYYHQSPPHPPHFSQQLTLLKNKSVIAKCSSYFSAEQKSLVPGACSGVSVSDGDLYGFSLYK